jgi:L-serine dehydratase
LPRPETEEPQSYPFRSGRDLLALGIASGRTIAEMMMANEVSQRPTSDVEAYLDRVAMVMMTCIDRGMVTDGELPGGLNVRRRALGMRRELDEATGLNNRSSHEVMDWVSLYAIAVTEENAAVFSCKSRHISEGRHQSLYHPSEGRVRSRCAYVPVRAGQ